MSLTFVFCSNLTVVFLFVINWSDFNLSRHHFSHDSINWFVSIGEEHGIDFLLFQMLFELEHFAAFVTNVTE